MKKNKKIVVAKSQKSNSSLLPDITLNKTLIDRNLKSMELSFPLRAKGQVDNYRNYVHLTNEEASFLIGIKLTDN